MMSSIIGNTANVWGHNKTFINYNFNTHTLEEKTHYGPGSIISYHISCANCLLSDFYVQYIQLDARLRHSSLYTGRNFTVLQERSCSSGGLEGGRGRLTEFTLDQAGCSTQSRPIRAQSERRLHQSQASLQLHPG